MAKPNVVNLRDFTLGMASCTLLLSALLLINPPLFIAAFTAIFLAPYSFLNG